MNQLQRQIDSTQRRLSLLQHLQREYQEKGSAASYCFSISSNVLFAEDSSGFRDALMAVVKELSDLHRFQVTQKLSGGRLQIQIGEAKEPAMVWIEEWFGGALAPAQMRRFSTSFDSLRKASEEHMMVTPHQPIFAADHLRRPEKHLAARVISDIVQRLDKTEATAQKAALSPESISTDAMPLALGYRVEENGKMLGPIAFPLTQMVHAFISGTTGSGKSFATRILIEEAAAYPQLSILVLDPRNQSLGILVPEDRPKIIEQYEEFGMKPQNARGYAFDYFAPGLPYAPALPKDLATLARGRSIVSFKGLNDAERCATAARILEAAFAACNEKESELPRLLVLLDEAHLFTRRRLDESAKEAAGQIERAMELLGREGRKFGLILVITTQSTKDFGYELASVRQMSSTKLFMRNSDRDADFAADIIGDGRLLAQLPTGVGILHHPNWGVTRVRVRPPHSKVFELGEAEVRQLVGKDRNLSKMMSAEAQALYAVIREHGSSPREPLNLSRAADLGGISSKRRLLELIEELEEAGVIRTRQLAERGRPRVIELCSADLG